MVTDAQIKLFYYDSDSMKISISTDEDIEEALSQVDPGKMLKIFIVTEEE